MRKQVLYTLLEKINKQLEDIQEQIYILDSYKNISKSPMEFSIGALDLHRIKKHGVTVINNPVMVTILGKRFNGIFSNEPIYSGIDVCGNKIYIESKCKIKILNTIYDKKIINWLDNNYYIIANNGVVKFYACYSIKHDKKRNDKKYINDLMFIEL